MEEKTEKKKRVAWNKGKKRTEEEKQRQKETVMRKYGVPNVSQIPSVRKKISDSHQTDEWKQLVRDVKERRYGDPNYNNMDKTLKTKEDRYGNPNYNNMDKNVETKKKNNTFTSSKPEEIFYQFLVDKYGESDVIRQYKDFERYPFFCDFYVRSIDLFIELNLHPCHNFKRYDEDKDSDLLKILHDKSKSSKYYAQVIKVWTQSDPLKFSVAERNCLNYLVFYTKEEIFSYMKENC